MTLTGLPIYSPRGWSVDGATGIVYGAAGRWVGKELGRIGSHGYLVSTHLGRAHLLHRVVWEACVGAIPVGMVINHKNGVKTDNRLANLEVVTSAENNAHARQAGLHRQVNAHGPRHHSYRVTSEMHAAILARLRGGESGAAIARSLGLSAKTVSRINRGE